MRRPGICVAVDDAVVVRSQMCRNQIKRPLAGVVILGCPFHQLPFTVWVRL